MTDKNDIIKPLLEATEKSFRLLFKEHNEHFYYCTLVMIEVGTPCISALSYETLEKLASASEDYDNEYPQLKWSYADSPYCGFGFDEYFGDVEKIFEQCFNGKIRDDIEAFENEYLRWIASMEEVMKILDSRGLFGMGKERSRLFINAEIMPPEASNFDRAKRLNPLDIYKEWEQDWIGELSIDKPAVDWNAIWNPELCNVTLIKPVTDKKVILQIKKALSINKGLTLFIEDCQKTPLIILKNEPYKTVIENLKKFPLVQPFLSIEKQER